MTKCSVLAVVSLCCGIASGVWFVLVLTLANLEIILPRAAAYAAPPGALALGLAALLSGYLAQVMCRDQPHNRTTSTIAITGMIIAAVSLSLTLTVLFIVAAFANG